MRTLISETFLIIVVVVLVAVGLSFARNFIAETIEDIRTALEEKRLNSQIAARLKGVSFADLHSILMDVMLWDAMALLDWLETKSILTDDQKRLQVEECRRTIDERRSHYTNLVRDMEPPEIVKLIQAEVRDRDSPWRRKFLDRLERRLSASQRNGQDVEDGKEKK